MLDLHRMVARSDSIVVAIHFPHQKPSSEYYRLQGATKTRFLTELERLTTAVAQREYASAYTIHVFMQDVGGTTYGLIAVQPSADAVTDMQMRAIIDAASTGECVDRSSVPFDKDIDWLISRKCTK